MVRKLQIIAIFITSAIILGIISDPGPASAQLPSNVEDIQFLGHVGGVTKSVAVRDNFAIVSEGPSLVVLDITVPESPAIISRTSPFNDLIESFFLSENYLYVWASDLYVVDVTDLQNLTVIGSNTQAATYGSNLGYDIFVSGNYLYLPANTFGVQVFDVSDPTNPTKVSLFDTPGRVSGIYVVDNLAYVADKEGGLRILDVTDPANPYEVGFYEFGEIFNVFVEGDLAFLGNWDLPGLVILNISNPMNPTLVGSFEKSYGPAEITVNNNYAYIAEFNGSLRILDISDASNITEVGVYEELFTAVEVDISGSLAYVADAASGIGLRIIDISTPSYPYQVGYYFSGGEVLDVFTDGDFSFLGGLQSILFSADVKDPSNPQIIGHLFQNKLTQGLDVVGNYAYAVGSGLRIIDIEDPSTPQEIGYLQLIGDGIVIDGNYAYIAGSSSGFLIADISDPLNPTLVGSIDTPGTANGIFVDNNVAYVADSDNGLLLFDIGDPTNPEEIGHHNTPGNAFNVHVSNNIAYVADGSSGIRVIDVQDPMVPLEIGYYDADYDRAYDIYMEGDIAYVGNRGGLLLLDISDPTTPVEIKRLDTAYSGIGVSVENGFVYVASVYAGLYIFGIEGEPPPPPPPPPVEEIDYFALGDSIASGHGLMDDGTPCRRSNRAYPWKVASRLETDHGIEVNFPPEHFLACSGATAELTDKVDNDPNKWLGNQVDYVVEHLTDKPTLVSITIGANDFEWTNIRNLISHLYIRNENGFQNYVKSKSLIVRNAILFELGRLLSYSNVMVVITEVYNPMNTSSIFFGLRDPYNHLDACGDGVCWVRVDYAVTQLDAVITEQWQLLGQPEMMQIAQIRSAFIGHESPRWTCGTALPESDDTWIQYPGDPNSNSILRLPGWAEKIIDIESGNGDCFHPNEKGAEVFAEAVSVDALRMLNKLP